VYLADVNAAVATLGRGQMRSLGHCTSGDCPFPISSGWARYLLVPALAKASSRALAWHTGCEQQLASAAVFTAAARAGLRVGCENSGGIFDRLNGSAYEQAVTNFFQWSVSHDAAVTFLISGGSIFYSDLPKFLQCQQKQFQAGALDSACFSAYCTKCRESDSRAVKSDDISARVRPVTGGDAPLYRDASAPVNARVQDLIARMSTEEKVAQLLNPFTSAKAILQKYHLRVTSIQTEILN
jgi:hypothetical protein